jgi:isomerase DpgB
LLTTCLEIEKRAIVKIEIHGAEPLFNTLTTQLGITLDQADDLGPTTVMLVHVVGDMNPAAVHNWPGCIDIRSVSKWERILRRIERTALTTIVLVEHACSALALELLLIADRRLASNDFLVPHAISSENIWPGMALYRLSRQIGDARARKLFLDGTDITTTLALELSIIDETVDDLVSWSDRIAHLLTQAPLDDFAIRRRLMQDSLSTSFDDALGVHLAACDRSLRRSLVSSQECAETKKTVSAV